MCRFRRVAHTAGTAGPSLAGLSTTGVQAARIDHHTVPNDWCAIAAAIALLDDERQAVPTGPALLNSHQQRDDGACRL
jgi:hypothetical protein